MPTPPQPGGYNWRQELVDMRGENAEVLRGLEKLKRVARGDAMKILLLEIEVSILRNNNRIAELLHIKDR